MSEIVLVLTTLPADFDAEALARDLVAGGVAACVTIHPAGTSVYTWKGVVETARELQLVMKTTHARVPALWTALRGRHPYDVPEFLVVPVTSGHEDYLAWIRSTVQSSAC
jgi:periplasmic divalent cation tolerance protein